MSSSASNKQIPRLFSSGKTCGRKLSRKLYDVFWHFSHVLDLAVHCTVDRLHDRFYVIKNLAGCKTKDSPVILNQKILLLSIGDEAFFEFAVILPAVDFNRKPMCWERDIQSKPATRDSVLELKDRLYIPVTLNHRVPKQLVRGTKGPVLWLVIALSDVCRKIVADGRSP